MKKVLALILALSLSASMFVACGSKGGEQGGDAKKDTLTVAVSAEPASLDPLGKNDSSSSNLKQQIFDTLLIADGDKIVGGVIETYEFKDELTLVMKLRQGVKFHNGDPLTVEDIIYSLERSATSEFTSSKMAMVDLEKTKVVDESTIELALKSPFPMIPTELSLIYAMPKKLMEEQGDKFSEKPIGTGPFVFEQWVRGDRVELSANKEYWGTVPAFEKLIWRAITESSSRTIEVESGGVDIAFNIVPNDVKRLEENPKVNLQRAANYATAYIAFNNKKAPYDDVKVRQAISYAVDKAALVSAVYSGVGKVGTGPLAATVWGYEPDVKQYGYDPEKAKALLKEAGIPEGYEVTITTSDNQVRADTAEIMQNQLKAIGINAKVDVLENSTYLDKVIEGSLDIFILGWTTTSGDADYGLQPFLSTSPSLDKYNILQRPRG